MAILGEINILNLGVGAIFTVAFLYSAWLTVDTHGDLMIDDTRSGENDNDEASRMFLQLVEATRKGIVIHDDGDDSPESVYNDPKIIDALRQRIRSRGITVECLFNEADEPLELLDLAHEFPDNVTIWYLDGVERPTRDIHYKIVDEGRLVYLSLHDKGNDNRKFVFRNADKIWVTKGTHRRNGQVYMDEFRRGVKAARLHA